MIEKNQLPQNSNNINIYGNKTMSTNLDDIKNSDVDSNSVVYLLQEIEQLTNVNEELRNKLFDLENELKNENQGSNSNKINNETNLHEIQTEIAKLNHELFTIKNELEEKDSIIFKLEQEKKLLIEINKNFPIPTLNNTSSNVLLKDKEGKNLQLQNTTNALKYYIFNLFMKKEFIYKDNNAAIIRELFGKDLDYINFLTTRIECLEHQNFYLLIKSEKYVSKDCLFIYLGKFNQKLY